MTTGGKLAKLRREQNLTQEQLAELLGVSRQAISKWESGAAYPETEKLIRLGKLYHCSMDYLLMEEVEETNTAAGSAEDAGVTRIDLRSLCYERVSEKKIGGLPLWHINIGFGRVAKGVFAVGLRAKGIVAVGLAAAGVVSLGVCSVGLIALGSLAVGLAAIGAVSAGVLAIGAVAVGIFSLGACAVGDFAVGAAAIGKYAARGDAARAAVAVGISEANGSLYTLETSQVSTPERLEIAVILERTVPWYLSAFKKLFLFLLK